MKRRGSLLGIVHVLFTLWTPPLVESAQHTVHYLHSVTFQFECAPGCAVFFGMSAANERCLHPSAIRFHKTCTLYCLFFLSLLSVGDCKKIGMHKVMEVVFPERDVLFFIDKLLSIMTRSRIPQGSPLCTE